MLRAASIEDAADICAIYNHYVQETPITFEERSVATSEMARRIQETLTILPWFVWREDKELLGYCYANAWKGRPAYRYSVESTVYVRASDVGKGIGYQLYRTLILELKQRGFHAVLGGIALPNPASVALHERLGFEKVAHLREVGYKFGSWVDVGYWQLLLSASPEVEH